MSNNDEKNNFGAIRKILWPYTMEETKTLLPMTMMLSTTLFIYTTLRCVKDKLILDAPCSNEMVFSFLKFYFVLPASVIVMIYISTISKNISKKKAYYYISLPFLIFFALFNFVLFPNVELLHMSTETMQNYQALYVNTIIPAQLFVVFGNWVYSLFYIIAECSGNTLITFLFWKFANDALSREVAKKYYPIFGAFSNIGLITAGLIQINFGETVSSVCNLVIIALIVKTIVYWYINKNLITEWNVDKIQLNKKPVKKLGFIEGMKYVMSSTYLYYLGSTVLCYGIAISLCEQTWKGMVKRWCVSSCIDVSVFFGYFLIFTGISTFFVGFFLKNITKKYSWRTASLITPTVLVSTATAFYFFVLTNQGYMGAVYTGCISSITLVIIGGIQNIAGKSTKYSLFDPTSQLAYQPLSDEEKTTGKAAIDVVFGRLGKAAGGAIQVAFTSILQPLYGRKIVQADMVPYLLIIILMVGAFWIYSVIKLSVQYEAKIAAEDAESESLKEKKEVLEKKAKKNKEVKE